MAGMTRRKTRPPLPWVLPVLPVLAFLASTLAACSNEGGSPADAPPRGASAPASATHPTGTEPPAATDSPTLSGCAAGPVTVTLRPGAFAAQRLCVRVGTTVTAVVPPGPGGRRQGPRTSNPVFATITSSTTDPDGTAHVTIRAARPGAATVTWGTEGSNMLTLSLDVAAYPIP
ncbi:hypothetical protein OHS33_36245 [Streptomyces sp. NBC_00536]|uniref:hypothetical protein n=1 Tax=Streptomyces sp. NBC_00536 TaxID=2975769 RepID=UPI002E81AE86|nr:hypothetical protein [Streptomyces sp. NBC_00536]WUC83351.1 hypothetical protein OHS33_36245 [Streptomyces sp. NBC_00536]